MPDRRLGGFTLVEVLVALAVLAIALAGVMRLSAQTIDATVALRERSVALWVAQNSLAEHLIKQDWPEIETTDGETEMGGRTWYWRQKVSGTPNLKFRRIEITIRRDPKDEGYLIQLAGFVRNPR